MLRDFRVALRSFARRPAWVAAIVFTLALGIGASVAIFSFVDALVLRPLPFPDADRLYVVDALVGGEPGNLAIREYRALRHESGLAEDYAAYVQSQYNATGGGPPENVTATIGTGNLFAILGVPMFLGKTWPAELDFTMQYNVVLSHRVWQQRYGSRRDIVEQSIVLDGATYRVAGVLPEAFDYPVKTDLFRAVTSYDNERVRRFSVLARARSGVPMADVQAELDRLSRRFEESFPDANRGVRLRARPLRDAYVGAARPYLLLLPAAVGLLLVLACANVANLLLAHALARTGESAVRMALGANRRDLFRQSAIEALTLAAAGAVLGILGARLGVTGLTMLVRAELPEWFAVRIDTSALGFAVVVTIIVAIALALVPFLQMRRCSLETTLRQDASRSIGSSGSRRLRSVLLGAQAAVATMLLIAASVFGAGLRHLESLDVGFNPEQMLTARLDPPFVRYGEIPEISRLYRRLIDEVASEPGVTAVATSTVIPFSGLDVVSPRARPEGAAEQDGAEQPFVNFQIASPGYFATMQIPLARGRDFSLFDTEETTLVAIVSQRTARRFWGENDPIGKRLGLVWNQTGRGIGGGTHLWLTVVGVSGDARFDGLTSEPGLDVYAPNAQTFAGDSYLLIRSKIDPESLAPRLRPLIDRVDPEQSVFDIRTMADRVQASVWQQRVTSVVVGIFALVALALAVVGVHAVTAYAAAARRREIGVRLALGGGGATVGWRVVRESLMPVVGGLIVGMIAGSAGTLAISGVLPSGATPAPMMAAPTSLVIVIVAAVAAWLPVWRLLRRADLIQALRSE